MSKRKRNEALPKGLAPGERMKRKNLILDPSWAWVYTEVTTPAQITADHRQATCGFSRRNAPQKPICPNNFGRDNGKNKETRRTNGKEKEKAPTVTGELKDDEIIEISDDDDIKVPSCSKKACKNNPNCLNHLGQDKWLDEEEAYKMYSEASGIGEDPQSNARDGDEPVGLRNLGATCYANAFLQVWFRDLAFRAGVYRCLPVSKDGMQEVNAPSHQDSPIFQLQVTFAALQNLTQNVFNPVKLVESLQLRASEQQDAQEFSKLFMSLLATEFEKQSVPALKSLVSDQFEGTLTYGTMCSTCKNRSEHDTKFFELELNLENNCKLEDRIAALLQSESLSGDNKYHCSKCDSLQDATRYTALRQLPPVLHFSLLRFVFDLETLTRKKSKQSITFPPVIDMSQYLGDRPTKTKGGAAHSVPPDESNVYELKGILLHKGPSAYHGHYEAQMFDVTKKKWYQFNDEVVTPINPITVAKPKKSRGEDNEATGSGRKKNTARAKMIIQSDDEMEDIKLTNEPEVKSPSSSPESSGYITSKDAYMLIYTRREAPSAVIPNGHSSSDVSHQKSNSMSPRPAPVDLEPPVDVMKEVERLNIEYLTETEEYRKKATVLREIFTRTRNARVEIFKTWNITRFDEESVVVDRQVLEDWIMKGLVSPKALQSTNEEKGEEKEEKKEPSPSRSPAAMAVDSIKPEAEAESAADPNSSSTAAAGTETPGDESSPVPRKEMDNGFVVCEHGLLDPDCAYRMRRINKDAYEKIVAESGHRLDPELYSRDVCPRCVKSTFKEKLYSIEHPDYVNRFEAVEHAKSENPWVWISKPWLKDWRLSKPKLHDPDSLHDPPPDAADWRSHVICEHSKLTPSTTKRVAISGDAAALLQELFPQWQPPMQGEPPCEECMELSVLSRGDSQLERQRAESEKLKVRMFGNPLVTTGLQQDQPSVVMPSAFIRAWMSWRDRPQINRRPETIDASQLLCEHDLLNFDPNVEADMMDSKLCVIRLSEAMALEELYGGGPLIRITQRDHDGRDYHEHDIPVCQECRSKQKSAFDETQISVHLLPPEAPLPTPENHGNSVMAHTPSKAENDMPASSSSSSIRGKAKASPVTYGSSTRKSKRIRQQKNRPQKKTLRILKKDTVKDIKINIHEAFDIPTIYQRLFYKGYELTDNKVTVASLGILINDILELYEVKPPDEDDVAWGSDADAEPVKKRKEEGRAFGGTLLGGGSFVVPQKEVENAAKETNNASKAEQKPLSKTASPSPPTAMIVEQEKDSSDFDPMDLIEDDSDRTITCPACTFINPVGVSCCTICDSAITMDLDI